MPELRSAIVEGGRLVGGQSPQTVAPWWSFTKTVLAAAALVLVERGRLQLDTPVDGEAFTLRQLLQHRAGLRDYGELADYHTAVARCDPPWTRDEFLDRVAVLPRHAPETVWAYSNVGYRRVGEEIERGFDGPLAEALNSLVLRPLDVEGAVLATGETVPMAPGYDAGWVFHRLLTGPLESAARLLERLLTGGLIGEASLREMRHGFPLPQFAGPVFEEPRYGLGLMVPRTRSGATMEGHTGGGPGSTVAVYRCDATARTVAVFAEVEDQAAVEAAACELGAG